MENTNEQLDETLRVGVARDAHLRRALEFALEQSNAPVGSLAMLGALGALVDDADDVEAFEMAQCAILALVRKRPLDTDVAHAWHALRHGRDPNQDAITIVDLARRVEWTAEMYQKSGTLLPTGVAAVEAFRADYLVKRFGESVPGAKRLHELFAKLDQPRSSGGLTITGVVARIVDEARLVGARGKFANTLRRVDRVLGRRANPPK